MTDSPFRILGIPGSLRRASFNRGLIRAATDLAPEGVVVETYDIAPIPFYNEDVQAEGDPPPVRDFKQRIARADALLIATPEYNYSVPGVLKNAIDWASRPPDTSPLKRKPIAIVGASTSRMGTTRAQLAWRQVFVFTESYVLLKPELMVQMGRPKFDADGSLTDQPTRDELRSVVEALVAWARQVKGE